MDSFIFPEGKNDATVAALAAALQRHPQTLVLTGAGVSTESGIPAYRDHAGNWAHPPPMQHQTFVDSPLAQRRYWARSMLGWARMGHARPGPAHRALAALQGAGVLGQLVTQNVDGLHLQAGSTAVTELHGSVHQLVCLACGTRQPRAPFQAQLEGRNPAWLARWHAAGRPGPDGDVQLPADDAAYAEFDLPACSCGGALMPDVVFFGANVPRERVARVRTALAEAGQLLVVGSSLAVFSGFRFVRQAAADGLPVLAVNQGVTRGDALFQLKVAAPAGSTLAALAAHLGVAVSPPAAP